ncbi:MAG: hypothetical protein E7B29_21955, partial [Mixta calida]|nr:hypothetical protein [Mixta calida]
MYVFDVFPELVTTGGSTRQRVGGRTAVAESKVSIRLSSKVAIENCLRMLEESDKRLASSGPVDPSGPYDWQFVLKEEFPDGQGVIHFGVAWYD